jgi:hypothetical protein
MSTEAFNSVVAGIAQLTTDELRAVNTIICDKFKQTAKINAMQAATTFNVGDKVRWTGKHGTREGVITKIKSKNIDVDAGIHGRWIVTATLLSKI